MERQGDSPARASAADLAFRLRAESVEVDVRLRQFGDRWVAVTNTGGDQEVGLSSTARGALAAAVRQLRPGAAAALLADVHLFGVSLRLS